MKRAFFCVVWSAVFLFVAALAVVVSASLSAGDDPAKQERVAREAGEEWGPLVVFGSIALAVALGTAGQLPGTGRRRASESGVERPGMRPLEQPPSRPTAPLSSRLAPSVHRFSFLGFLSRWDRIIVAVPIFGGFGLFVLAGSPSPEASLGGLIFCAVAGMPTLLLTWRFLGVRWAQLDSSGVSWGGVFGSRHREWERIRSVTREELLVNRRHRTRMLRLDFEGGGSVTFDQALTDFDTLAGALQTVAGELILPRKWDELHRDGEADFGLVKLRPDGIKMKGKFFSWDHLGRYRIENGHLILYKRIRPRAGGDKGVPLSTIPNYPVLLTMMREGGAPL